MAAITNQPSGQHWKERALEHAEAITDSWEVTKAYAGRLAEWILFLCMIFCIVEILPGVTLYPWLSNTILGIQAVTLDVGGFALSSMADHARLSGDITSAKKADTTGKFLIGIVILTLTLITIGLLYAPAKQYTDGAEKLLILVRVVMTVVYGHVIHSLRKNVTPSVQPTQVVTLENRLQEMAVQMTENQNSLVQQLREEIETQRQAINQLITNATFKTDDITHDSFVDIEMEDDLNVETSEEGTKTEELPLSKITVKLTPDITKVSTKKEPTAKQKAAKMLQRNANLTASDIAKKLNITRQYASAILAEMKGN